MHDNLEPIPRLLESHLLSAPTRRSEKQTRERERLGNSPFQPLEHLGLGLALLGPTGVHAEPGPSVFGFGRVGEGGGELPDGVVGLHPAEVDLVFFGLLLGCDWGEWGQQLCYARQRENEEGKGKRTRRRAWWCVLLCRVGCVVVQCVIVLCCWW